jgi:hypothetical protein
MRASQVVAIVVSNDLRLCADAPFLVSWLDVERAIRIACGAWLASPSSQANLCPGACRPTSSVPPPSAAPAPPALEREALSFIQMRTFKINLGVNAFQSIECSEGDISSLRRFWHSRRNRRRRSSVLVLRSTGQQAGTTAVSINQKTDDLGLTIHRADLAMVDLRSHAVERISRSHPRWFSVSADGRYVAYTDEIGSEANSSQPNYDLYVYEVPTRRVRMLASHARMNYGNEVSWSPDSRHLVYVESGPVATGGLVVVSTDGSETATAVHMPPPSFDTSHGARAPLWNRAGDKIYAIGADGKLCVCRLRSATHGGYLAH